MANTNKNTFTAHAKAIVEALKGNLDGLTIAELTAITGMEIKSGHVVSLSKRGYVEVIGEREVMRPAKRKVATYVYVTSDVLNKEDGKPFNYTDGETAVLAAAAGFDGPFSLADLAAAMNKERMTSGSINGLVKKGNIARGENDLTIDTLAKSSVNVYGFVKDLPADAEIR